MSSFPWLTVIGAIPLVGALVIAIIPTASSDDSATSGPATPPNAGSGPATPPNAGSGPATPPNAGSGPATPPYAALAPRDRLTKQIALVTALVTLGMTIAMAVKFSPNGPAFQFVEI